MQSYPIGIHIFTSPDNPLRSLPQSTQRDYLIQYLADLNASTIIEETAYFDRDFLSEFADFYSVSAAGYVNRCRRLHVFSGASISRADFERAVEGKTEMVTSLQESYLGFIVLRPIPSAPFGRTVVKWYPDSTPNTPRVTNPSRDYTCNVAGIALKVRGLAWQQQDQGVSACATIALWTMLHSSAFDEHHSIPTTTEITKRAHRTISFATRVFPSQGLNVYQVCEAIKECGLAPVVCPGDIQVDEKRTAFSRSAFCSLAASLIRSGYPALITGELEGKGIMHAVCAVGFREYPPVTPKPSEIELQDGRVEYFYVHDDNLGPLVRFQVEEHPKPSYVCLAPSAPTPLSGSTATIPAISGYPRIVPSYLIAAVHDQMRVHPSSIHQLGLRTGKILCEFVNELFGENTLGITLSFWIMKLSQYVGRELFRTLGADPAALRSARLQLCEHVPPMSLHIAVARFGWGETPLFDVLYDTTDSESTMPSFCHVVFDPIAYEITAALSAHGDLKIGMPVKAFS